MRPPPGGRHSFRIGPLSEPEADKSRSSSVAINMDLSTLLLSLEKNTAPKGYGEPVARDKAPSNLWSKRGR